MRNKKATKSMTKPTINNVSVWKTLFIKNSLDPTTLLAPNNHQQNKFGNFFNELHAPLLFNLRQNLAMTQIK